MFKHGILEVRGKPYEVTLDYSQLTLTWTRVGRPKKTTTKHLKSGSMAMAVSDDEEQGYAFRYEDVVFTSEDAVAIGDWVDAIGNARTVLQEQQAATSRAASKLASDRAVARQFQPPVMSLDNLVPVRASENEELYALDQGQKEYIQVAYPEPKAPGRGERLSDHGLVRSEEGDPWLQLNGQLNYGSSEAVQRVAARARMDMDRVEHVLGFSEPGHDGIRGQDGRDGRSGQRGRPAYGSGASGGSGQSGSDGHAGSRGADGTSGEDGKDMQCILMSLEGNSVIVSGSFTGKLNFNRHDGLLLLDCLGGVGGDGGRGQYCFHLFL